MNRVIEEDSYVQACAYTCLHIPCLKVSIAMKRHHDQGNSLFFKMVLELYCRKAGRKREGREKVERGKVEREREEG